APEADGLEDFELDLGGQGDVRDGAPADAEGEAEPEGDDVDADAGEPDLFREVVAAGEDEKGLVGADADHGRDGHAVEERLADEAGAVAEGDFAAVAVGAERFVGAAGVDE